MWLTIRSGEDAGKAVEVAGERFVIGRDEGCDLLLADERASRQHASLDPLPDGRLALHDLGSTNGTFVNGRRVSVPVVLDGEETIQIGNTMIAVTRTESQTPPTVVGVTPGGSSTASAESPPPLVAETPGVAATPSAVERLKLRRSVRRLGVLAAVLSMLAVAGIAVGVLFATGVIGGSKKEPVQASIPQIVAAVKPSVVRVKVKLAGASDYIGSGSGWVLDAKAGLIVTNAHVVNAGGEYTVAVGKDDRSAAIVGVAPCEDLAVLRVRDTAGLKTIPLGSQEKLEQGQTVIVLGYPVTAALAEDLTATAGVVSVVRTQWNFPALDVARLPNVIQTDAPINPGNSGGPLVDLAGELVGVNTAVLPAVGGRPIQGEGYSIGVDRVKAIIPTLRNGGSLQWTGAGFDFPADVQDMSTLGLPSGVPGLLITHVVPGTPADAAGLGKQVSLVTAIDGKPLDGTFTSYCNAVKGFKSGDTAAFSVIYPGQTTATSVQVGFK